MYFPIPLAGFAMILFLSESLVGHFKKFSSVKEAKS
jgi:hypothetical protein